VGHHLRPLGILSHLYFFELAGAAKHKAKRFRISAGGAFSVCHLRCESWAKLSLGVRAIKQKLRPVPSKVFFLDRAWVNPKNPTPPLVNRGASADGSIPRETAGGAKKWVQTPPGGPGHFYISSNLGKTRGSHWPRAHLGVGGDVLPHPSPLHTGPNPTGPRNKQRHHRGLFGIAHIDTSPSPFTW